MKILIVNKFLYPNGGAETYIFKLGDYLKSQGHEVQYFGMEHGQRRVGNNANAYTNNMDFHKGPKWSKLAYPIKIIYSSEARKKIRQVLDDFQPDVVHLNNFNYQLTPSIILEVRKWSRKSTYPCRIVFTAHDYQLICPNHQLHNPISHENCEKCLGGHFSNCLKGKCIHGSLAESFVGMMEAFLWNKAGVYKNVDAVICCSRFMKEKMDSNPIFKKKTVVLYNFAEKAEQEDEAEREYAPYILYFGRFSEEKGIRTLVRVCRELPQVKFIFAGSGPLENEIKDIPNINNIGFQKGKLLRSVIRQAKFSVYPSEWYENCPFSVIESQMYGTPVLGANIGGIPELIEDGKTGELFQSGSAEDLKKKIVGLWNNEKLVETYKKNCRQVNFNTLNNYCERLLKIYLDK